MIAGATSLGLAVAHDLAARGANVVLLDGRAELVENLATQIGGPALGITTDITDPVSVDAAFEAAIERFGRIDINVNTASYFEAIPLVGPDGHPSDPDRFSRMMTTNVVGTFIVMSRAAAAMLHNEPDTDGERGVIINTPLDAANDPKVCMVGTVGMIGYSATKAALVGMTLPAALEFIGRGVRVNTLAAGGYETPIFDGQVHGHIDGKGGFDHPSHQGNPPRLERPDAVAELAAYIVENRFFNAAAPRLEP